MKRILLVLIVLFSISVPLVVGFAATSKGTSKGHAGAKVQSAVCPVMGTKIPDVSKAAGKSVYKGKTYYFCCPGCKPKFDKDPQKYVGKKK